MIETQSALSVGQTLVESARALSLFAGRGVATDIDATRFFDLLLPSLIEPN